MVKKSQPDHRLSLETGTRRSVHETYDPSETRRISTEGNRTATSKRRSSLSVPAGRQGVGDSQIRTSRTDNKSRQTVSLERKRSSAARLTHFVSQLFADEGSANRHITLGSEVLQESRLMTGVSSFVLKLSSFVRSVQNERSVAYGTHSPRRH